eukprot:g13323.t1
MGETSTNDIDLSKIQSVLRHVYQDEQSRKTDGGVAGRGFAMRATGSEKTIICHNCGIAGHYYEKGCAMPHEDVSLKRSMAAFFARARKEKQQLEQQQQQKEERGPCFGGACADAGVAPHMSPAGGEGRPVEVSSSPGSAEDMSIRSGHGLSQSEWVSDGEVEGVEDFLDDNCDSSDGVLDALDFDSDVSLSSSSNSSSSSSSRSSRSRSRSGSRRSCDERDADTAPVEKGAVDVRQGGEANGDVVDSTRGTDVTTAGGPAKSAPRRSSRDSRFGGKFCAATREYNCDSHKGGTGRGNKILLPEEAQDRSVLVSTRVKTRKGLRTMRRERVPREGKTWKKTQLDQARGRTRTRKHWTRRKQQLMDTYRHAFDKLQKAEHSESYASVVEDLSMLDATHLVHTTTVITAVKHFVHLELQDGVQKMEHSRTVANLAEVDSKTVRRWVKEFCKDGAFVVRKRRYNKRGPHSYIDDEDIRLRLKEYIEQRLYHRKKDDPRLRVGDVQKWVNEVLLKEELAGTRGISRRTAHKWMARLGFRWSTHKKCVYVDGHNRPDVVRDRRVFVKLLLALRNKMSIPVRFEETVMQATSRGKARQQGDDSDVSGDERDSRASSETSDDERMNGGATGRQPLLWPAVREVDGKKEYKHVRVYGDTTMRVEGDCTRIPFDARDLAASDTSGDYRLLPDAEVKEFYRPKTVKRDMLAWPAVRTVKSEDGKEDEEFTHVLVHNPPYARGGDCARKQPEECPCAQRSGVGRCSCYLPCGCDDCKRKPAQDSTQIPFDKRDLIATDGRGDYTLLPDQEVLALFFHDETTAKENDDGNHQWMSATKGAAMKVKGEGRAVHISAVIGPETGQQRLAPEVYAMMKEDKDAPERGDPANGPAWYYGGEEGEERSGWYYGRKEGEGEDGHARKKQDGYWTCDRMCAQLPAIIALAELTMAPHRQGVFIFDNSTGHGAYDDNALLAQNINMAPGGEKVAWREFKDDNGKTVHPTFQVGDTLLTGKKIYLPKTAEQKKNPKRKLGTVLSGISVGTKVESDSPLLGVSKGAEQLLREMGLWQLPGEKKGPVLCCKGCKAENAASRQAITAFNRGGEGRERVLEQAQQDQQEAAGGTAARRQRCCVQRIFSELKAFKEQLNKVEQIFKAAGHICIFLPKYHPELNAIERYWGYIKHLLRLHCEYSLPHMLKILPGTMSDVPLEFIRAWSRVAWLYAEAYDYGLEDYLESRALKQWGKHREATARGDAVVQARGAGTTNEEKTKAEKKALEAAQECRTISVRKATRAFKKWKNERAAKERCAANGGEEKEAEMDVS